MTFRVLFAIAAYYDLNIHQINIKTVFLLGLIDQLVYVQILKDSEDFTKKIKVYKLLKALYSPKQVSKLWYKRLSKFLLTWLDFCQININSSIFVTVIKINRLVVSMFVNDIKILKLKELSHIKKVKQLLAAAFKMVDMEPISF